MVQPPLDREAIKQIIPHRDPFLFVDEIVELEVGASAVGIYNVTGNEPFFEGHFPGFPIMPGVLQVEALAQVACVTMMLLPELAGKAPLFTGIENMKFRKPVVPRDQLRLEFTLTKSRGPLGWAHVKASVDGKMVAEGDISFAIGDMPTKPNVPTEGQAAE